MGHAHSQKIQKTTPKSSNPSTCIGRYSTPSLLFLCPNHLSTLTSSGRTLLTRAATNPQTQMPLHGTVIVLIAPASLGAAAQLSKRGVCFISLCSLRGDTGCSALIACSSRRLCAPARQVDQDSWALSSQEGRSPFQDAIQGLFWGTWNNLPSSTQKLGRDEREWFGTPKTFSHLDPIQVSDASPLDLQKEEPTCSTFKQLVASTLIYGRFTHLHYSCIQISAQPGTTWLPNQRD